MKARLQVLLLVLLLPACADSCGCGEPKQSEPNPVTSGAAEAPESNGAAAANKPHSAEDNERTSAQLESMRNRFSPVADTKERAKLERAAKQIDRERDLGEPIAATRFKSALPERIGDYRAEGGAQVGETPAEQGKATVAARRYRAGKSLMHVKITDTADAPGLRRELAEQLTLVGNEPTGHQKGHFEAGVAGVVAYHQPQAASRAMALLDGRFLVEVMVEQAAGADVAWSAIEQLDTKSLKR